MAIEALIEHCVRHSDWCVTLHRPHTHTHTHTHGATRTTSHYTALPGPYVLRPPHDYVPLRLTTAPLRLYVPLLYVPLRVYVPLRATTSHVPHDPTLSPPAYSKAVPAPDCHPATHTRHSTVTHVATPRKPLDSRAEGSRSRAALTPEASDTSQPLQVCTHRTPGCAYLTLSRAAEA